MEDNENTTPVQQEPQPFGYVTYDDAGALTGCYFQTLHPEHAANHIAVSDAVRAEWFNYRANDARGGVELLPPIVPPAPTESQIVASYEKALDDHIDATAKSYGYISIITAVSYADETAVAKFQQEGQALRAWRSMCYAHGHDVMAAVKAGERVMPTIEELIAELPVLDIGYPGTFDEGAAKM